jgi:chromatin remodeling complex protein RSC6
MEWSRHPVGSEPFSMLKVSSRRYLEQAARPEEQRMIKADAALKVVFGDKSTVNMFEMTRS